MKELLIATTNKGKIKELEKLLNGVVKKVLSIQDFPGFPAVEEDGETFRDNAIKKAVSAFNFTGIPVIADDSGLVVDILGGKPGVFSARYAGENANDAANNAKLLEKLSAIPTNKRKATFQCVIAFCKPEEECRTFKGELHGIILEKPLGDSGFGYDPLFLVPEYGKTLAELPIEIKNRISHRGVAMKKFSDFLTSNNTL
ncbi:MAG: XTP/dITP diphosphatase [Desulfuromonadales bacterium]|nr:XTP/dITP diphosphatase [Desulfuromonadales bacterium]